MSHSPCVARRAGRLLPSRPGARSYFGDARRRRRRGGPLQLPVPERAEDAEEDGGEDDQDADDARRRDGVVVEQTGDEDGQALPRRGTGVRAHCVTRLTGQSRTGLATNNLDRLSSISQNQAK